MKKGVLLSKPPTRRGLEILGLFAEGLSVKEVAFKLGISVWTVRWHLRVLYLKLKATGVTHAVALAIRGGYLEQ